MHLDFQKVCNFLLQFRQIQKQKNIRNCAEEIVLIGLVYT